jgi:polyphosphate:AMP phosphotransferase
MMMKGRNRMLEKVDLSKKLGKEEYKTMIRPLYEQMGRLQRKAKDLKIPVMIVFEGWDAAGKGTMINEMIQALDPRGFDVFSIHEPNEEEQLRPYFWRFWTKTASAGRITIFDRSWYSGVLFRDDALPVDSVEARSFFQEALSFERQLSDAGALIIKCFLHIDKKEQKKRLEKLQNDKASSWRVTENDWENHYKYDAHLVMVEEMLRQTDTGEAPWTVIEAHDRKFALAKLVSTVGQALEKRILQAEELIAKQGEFSGDLSGEAAAVAERTDSKAFISSVLSNVDLTKSLTADEYQSQLKDCQKRMRDLEYICYGRRLPVIIAFEGWDAAGKGGCIRRLTQHMDPRGYTVVPVGAPTDEEKAHHYLWRFWRHVPKAGHIAIFDRSWYGRVLVERVEGFCKEEDWRRAYKEMNEMEEQWDRFGAVVVKFWLHIDRDEQQRRFEDRMSIPDKRWKITDEDWRNREKWDLYEQAVDEMFLRTSTVYAPWTIVEANSKDYARIKVLKTVIAAIEKKLAVEAR